MIRQPAADRLSVVATALKLVGPGVVVMLADTDAASILTAVQSGRQWGYRLLLLQVVLIPVMYVAQELSVRVGLSTGRGFLEFTEMKFGRRVGAAFGVLLGVSCFGALVTELCGLAGVGQLFGLPVGPVTFGAAAVLLGIFVTHSYRSVERVALVFGAFELAFVVAAWRAQPDLGEVVRQMRQSIGTDQGFLLLVAAGIGTSVMPWTIAYQQSALIAKGVPASALRGARLDTLLGAVVCQAVTASILIAAAGRGGASDPMGSVVESIPAIAREFSPLFGGRIGTLVFAAALAGAAVVATIVVCLAAAWATCEVTGARRSLDDSPRRAPVLYGVLAVMLTVGAGIVSSGMDLVDLAVDIAAWNAVLLPAMLLLLVIMARDPACGVHRLRGAKAFAVAALLFVTSAVGLYAGVAAFLPD